MATVGEKIRAARQLRGLTQADLSGDEVSASMISQIEMNKTRPSLPLLQLIAKRLGMPVEHFVDDLDEEFAPDVQLAKANYYLLRNETELALAALAPGIAVFDARYTKYKATLARAYLQAKAHDKCMEVLEELREYALFSQDMDTLLTVHCLSGYLEYDTKHFQAAIHEWERTITTGEKLLENNRQSLPSIKYLLMDTYFSLYHAHMQLGEASRAAGYLRRAADCGKAWSTLCTLSESLFECALETVNLNGSRKPLELIESAIWALEIGIGLNKYNHIRSEAALRTETAGYNPWHQSILALKSVQPKAAFDADIAFARRLLENEQYEEASKRMEQAIELLGKFNLSTEDEIPIHYALSLILAEAQHARGYVAEALETIQSALMAAESMVPLDELLYGQSLLLRWLRSKGDVNAGRAVIQRIMARLEREEKQSDLHIME